MDGLFGRAWKPFTSDGVRVVSWLVVSFGGRLLRSECLKEGKWEIPEMQLSGNEGAQEVERRST